MKRTISIALLILIALPVVVGALETEQMAVQPLWFRETHKGVLTGATDTVVVIQTNGLDMITLIIDHACSLKVKGTAHTIFGNAAWLPAAGDISLAVSDPESVRIWVGGPGDKYWSLLGSKR